MQVGDELFNKNEISRLYYPLSESLSAAPVRPYETDVSTRLSIRIVLANGGKLGPAEIALLEEIHAQGSISGAARAIGLTHRTSWLRVQEVNRALGEPAVATKIGGRNYGGAVLTPIGTQIVDLYRAIEASVHLAADAELRAIEALARHGKTRYRAGEE
jgi:molybdate transport system regulatory protein